MTDLQKTKILKEVGKIEEDLYYIKRTEPLTDGALNRISNGLNRIVDIVSDESEKHSTQETSPMNDALQQANFLMLHDLGD